MDSSPFDSGPQLDLGKLSESDKRELQQVVQGETQKAKIQECRSILAIRLSFFLALIASSSSNVLAPLYSESNFSKLKS